VTAEREDRRLSRDVPEPQGAVRENRDRVCIGGVSAELDVRAAEPWVPESGDAVLASGDEKRLVPMGASSFTGFVDPVSTRDSRPVFKLQTRIVPSLADEKSSLRSFENATSQAREREPRNVCTRSRSGTV